MNKLSILTSALEGRDHELLTYQINIDNYRLQIFRQELEERLAKELRRQLRARIIQDVLVDQLAEL